MNFKKATVSMFLATSLLLGSSVVDPSSIQAAPATATNKVPDAFNKTLEKEALQDYQKKNGKLSLSEPIVLNFPDGSSITYSAEVTPQENKTQGIVAAALPGNYSYSKTYQWGVVGSASVTLKLNNVRHENRAVYPSSTASDSYQVVGATTFAKVTTGQTSTWTTRDSGSTHLRARAVGSIDYDIAGLGTRQVGYDFVVGVDPALPWDIVLISG